jgi:DNA-binding MarR family transcriptional regulator
MEHGARSVKLVRRRRLTNPLAPELEPGAIAQELVLFGDRLQKVRKECVDRLGVDLASTECWTLLVNALSAEARGEDLQVTRAIAEAQIPYTSGGRAINKLEDAGLLRRHRSRSNGGYVLIRLTEEGRETVASILRSALQ